VPMTVLSLVGIFLTLLHVGLGSGSPGSTPSGVVSPHATSSQIEAGGADGAEVCNYENADYWMGLCRSDINGIDEALPTLSRTGSDLGQWYVLLSKKSVLRESEEVIGELSRSCVLSQSLIQPFIHRIQMSSPLVGKSNSAVGALLSGEVDRTESHNRDVWPYDYVSRMLQYVMENYKAIQRILLMSHGGAVDTTPVYEYEYSLGIYQDLNSMLDNGITSASRTQLFNGISELFSIIVENITGGNHLIDNFKICA